MEDTICGIRVTRVPEHEGHKYVYERVPSFGIGIDWPGAWKEKQRKKEENHPADKESDEGTRGEGKDAPPETLDDSRAASGADQDWDKKNGVPLPTKVGNDNDEAKFIPMGSAKGEAEDEALEEGQLEEESLEFVPSDDEEAEFDNASLPWEGTCRKIYSPLLRLHEEILRFTDFLKPTPEEQMVREAAVERVRSVILAIWPQASAEVFGSFETGLYLPTSDIDMVILNSKAEDIPQALRRLAGKISRKGMAKDLLVLSKARVPIVKFEDVETGLNFDISFDIDGGPEAAKYIKDMMSRMPQLRPLVMILKIFLQQRELNEVYSGGIGSYALITITTAFLQTHAGRVLRGEPEGCLGVLLIDFFDLYGNIMDVYEVGVSCRHGGFFYDKVENGMFNNERPFLLSVQDPRDPDSDVCKNSFNFQKIRSAFQFAHTLLTAPEEEPGELLLMRIIRLDGILVKRLEDQSTPSTAPGAAAHFVASGPAGSHGKAHESKSSRFTEDEKFDMLGVISVSSSDDGGDGVDGRGIDHLDEDDCYIDDEEGIIAPPKPKKRKGRK